MTYTVKEAFLTLQGEGFHAGRAAVFCRFTGCNLWTGREEDRTSAACQFCDTDFVGTDGDGGGVFAEAGELAAHLASMWPHSLPPFFVFTGGEPALQLDEELVAACKEHGATLAIETNGTRALPAGLDWICVSPKAGQRLVITEGHELKVVMPQEGINLEALAGLDFTHRSIQPMDGAVGSTAWCVEWCQFNPSWRLSFQTHKALGVR